MRGGVATAVAAALLAGVGAAPARSAGIAFDAHARDRLVVTAPAYRLTLSKRNGKILDLVDRASGTSLLRDGNGCLWGTALLNGKVSLGGCSFTPRGVRRFSYRWHPASATLTLDYRAPGGSSAVVTLRARASFFDLRLTIANRDAVRAAVSFPAGLVGDSAAVTAGYAPNALPGVLLKPGFFSRVGNDVEIYPSRWAFADYLALDLAGGHVALYSVATGALHPVNVGFAHLVPPSRCSGGSFCVVHDFQTWIRPGATWTSPVVRIRTGESVERSILAYRHDNGIDAYPSLESKLGARLDTLARAPLVKANLPWTAPFRDWGPDLQALPSPVLLHPVGYEPGGHDAADPDFLPPDPQWGTEADFAAMIAQAHARGDLVMPYTNLSWWDPSSPTMQSLPPPLQTKDVAVLDPRGQPATVDYGDHAGVIVSPFAPFVQQRVAQAMAAWRTDVPADCLFLDQIGARPWLRDFNAAAPDPLAYDDGWLSLMAPYAGRCLMAEDGWDRLARDFVGFHGSLLMLQRELGLADTFFGAGNWEPYPLATWLFHDKVLMYEHDLYDGTMATDGEVLTWNMAFGLVGSWSWDPAHPLGSPWLQLVAQLQRAVGPHYAGVPLAGYRTLAPEVTESVFGDLTVVANLSTAAYAAGGDGIAPDGFRASTRDGSVVAGAFAGTFDGAPLSAGTHYLIVERDAAGVTVRQPVGADTDLAVAPPAGGTLRVTALAADGTPLGAGSGELRGGAFVLHYAAQLDGRPVAAYRIAPG